MKNIVLASQSPRRRELLTRLGYPYTTDSADIDETLDLDLGIQKAVEALALRKARAVEKKHTDSIIITADTVVVLNDKIYGKAKDAQDAFVMLKELSGHTHQVMTSMCLMYQDKNITFTSITDVEFYELNDQDIHNYIETGEAYDKAGAYGIQDLGALFIKKIDGDYYTVMGLPVALLKRKLEAFIQSI
jgi:septum formation protein